MDEESFEETCRLRFNSYCAMYRLAKYHSLKRKYVELAYLQVDAWLDWKDVQGL